MSAAPRRPTGPTSWQTALAVPRPTSSREQIEEAVPGAANLGHALDWYPAVLMILLTTSAELGATGRLAARPRPCLRDEVRDLAGASARPPPGRLAPGRDVSWPCRRLPPRGPGARRRVTSPCAPDGAPQCPAVLPRRRRPAPPAFGRPDPHAERLRAAGRWSPCGGQRSALHLEPDVVVRPRASRGGRVPPAEGERRRPACGVRPSPGRRAGDAARAPGCARRSTRRRAGSATSRSRPTVDVRLSCGTPASACRPISHSLQGHRGEREGVVADHPALVTFDLLGPDADVGRAGGEEPQHGQHPEAGPRRQTAVGQEGHVQPAQPADQHPQQVDPPRPAVQAQEAPLVRSAELETSSISMAPHHVVARPGCYDALSRSPRVNSDDTTSNSGAAPPAEGARRPRRAAAIALLTAPAAH